MQYLSMKLFLTIPLQITSNMKDFVKLTKRKQTYIIVISFVLLSIVFTYLHHSTLEIHGPIGFYIIPTFLGLAVGLLCTAFIQKVQTNNNDKYLFCLNLVELLANALNEKDDYTIGHSHRVTRLSMELGNKLKLSNSQMEILRLSAILHDIGKIGVPDTILLKPNTLTPEEYDIVQQHPKQGASILQPMSDRKLIKQVIVIIRHHHEQFDGSGYPHGLTGDSIPYLSRIITLADSFDAMTSDRPYRKKMSKSLAIQEIKKGAGIQFDPILANTFIEALEGEIADALCEKHAKCKMLPLIKSKEISRSFELQYCRANYEFCARYKIKNKANRPINLLPDGTYLRP